MSEQSFDRAVDIIVNIFGKGPYLLLNEDESLIRKFKRRTNTVYKAVNFRGKSRKIRLELPDDFADVSVLTEKLSFYPHVLYLYLKEITRVTSGYLILIANKKSASLNKERMEELGYYFCKGLSTPLDKESELRVYEIVDTEDNGVGSNIRCKT